MKLSFYLASFLSRQLKALQYRMFSPAPYLLSHIFGVIRFCFLLSPVIFLCLFSGCKSKKAMSRTSEIYMKIDGNKYTCAENKNEYCYRVSYTKSGEEPAWEDWNGDIEGLTIKSSNIYEVTVIKTENMNTEGGEKSTVRYKLKEVLKKEPYSREGNKNYNFLQNLWTKGVIFYVRGNEPGWMVDFYKDGKITFSSISYPELNFETSVGQTELAEKSREKSYLFKDRQASLVLLGDKCEDSMSGELFTYQATFEMGGKLFSGCGMAVPDVRLNDIFVFEKMLYAEGQEPDFHFEEKPYIEFNIDQLKLFGFGGCNEIGANFVFEAEGIRLGPVMSSRKACPDISEPELVKFLSDQILRYELKQPTTLILKSKNGMETIWRKVD